MKTLEKEKYEKSINSRNLISLKIYLLDSAGEGGFSVSGLIQSDGEGDLSFFVVTCPNPSDNTAECPNESDL